MDFELPDDLKMVQRLSRDFVAGELKPLERDLLGRAADIADAHAYLDPVVEGRLSDTARGIGLWGIGIPAELGGAGLGTLGDCVVEEELAQTAVPFDFGRVTPILFECSPEQVHRYFTPVFNRDKAVYLAFLGSPVQASEGAPGRPGGLTGDLRHQDGRRLSPGRVQGVVIETVRGLLRLGVRGDGAWAGGHDMFPCRQRYAGLHGDRRRARRGLAGVFPASTRAGI